MHRASPKHTSQDDEAKRDDLAPLLGAREKELIAIYENVPGIVFYIALDRDGEFRFLSVSRDFLKATGLRREEVVGSLVRDLTPPSSREVVLNHYRQALRSGQPVRWQEESVLPGGKRYGEVAVTPLCDGSGVATHLIGIVHDIAECKRLEERRAGDLLEAAPVALVVVDQTGRIVLVNAQTETLFGYQREDLLGHAVEILIPQRFCERHQAHRASFFSAPRVRPMGAQLELFGLRKDGTEFPVEVALSPIQTDKGVLVTSAIRDVTDRKVMEEVRFRVGAIVESSDDAIISKNLDAGITSWNAAAQRIFGYTEEETIGQPMTILIPPELGDEENKILARLRAGERIEHYETIRVTKAGRKVNVSLTVSPIRDATGKIVGYSQIAHDITGRKRAEEARLRHAAIVESSEDAILSVSLDGVIVTWNPGAQRMFGYTEKEVVGKPITIIVPPERPDEENKILETLRAGASIEQFETVRVSKTGKRVDVSLSISPIKDPTGTTIGYAGIERDITKRKRAEEASLGSEQRYRLLFERNVAGVGIGSLDGRLLDCNDGWARILGCESKDELIGRQASEFYFHPAERQRLLNELLENQAVFSRELQMRRKDGSPVWVLFNAAALNSEHNVPIVQSTMIDISEWKRAEEALAGMTRKLIEAQEQERSRIGRELHDDINQRLAMLSVELEQLGDNSFEVNSRVQELREELRQISDDVQAISHDLHSSHLEYLGAIAGMKSWCKEVAGRRKIEVAFSSDLSGHLALDVGLPLFRVLQEAVTNSIKHSGQKRIEVQLREDSGEIHLVVRDSGKGFDVKTALQGKGLGLTSMRERVRLVNGTIAIDSQPTVGTTIHVRVPLRSEKFSERLAS